MTYIGKDIIRDYKGFKIKKTTNVCRETVYYVIHYEKGISHPCSTLKEAKQYIDKMY